MCWRASEALLERSCPVAAAQLRNRLAPIGHEHGASLADAAEIGAEPRLQFASADNSMFHVVIVPTSVRPRQVTPAPSSSTVRSGTMR